MSNGSGTRFRKGQSGNPAGRPKARRPNVSAFDVIIDKVLTVNQGGVERELTVDEALQLQTYQAALKGSRMAVRHVLKMIEKREAELARRSKPRSQPVTVRHSHSAVNHLEAMRILDIGSWDPACSALNRGEGRFKLSNWAAQAALSRGSQPLTGQDVSNVKLFTDSSDKLKWPSRRLPDDS